MYSPLWTTKDGRVYKIEEMETRHIHNCIRMILRNWPRFRPEYLQRLDLELTIRDIKSKLQS